MSTGPAPSLAAGLHLLDAGRPELAEPYLRRALAEEPDSALAHAMLAECLAGHGTPAEAAAEARTALQLAPDACFAHAAAATASRARGRLEEAEASARMALELHLAGVEHYPPLADLLLQRGEPAASLEVASAGLAIDSRSAHCLNAKAAALAGQGEIDQARAVVQDALVSAPESAVLHQNLGYVLLLSGQRESAIAELQEALRLDPMLDMAERNLAAARRMAADGDPSMLIARARLLAMSRQRQAVLILAFVLAGFVAPVCWVVAALVARLRVPPPAGSRHTRPRARVAKVLARRLAFPVVLGGLFVAMLWVLGFDGLVAWFGGAAVALWLATAAASKGTRVAQGTSLGAAACIIAVSAMSRVGIEAPYPTLVLYCLSLASFPAARALTNRVRPLPSRGSVDDAGAPSTRRRVAQSGQASTSSCTCYACQDAALYT